MKNLGLVLLCFSFVCFFISWFLAEAPSPWWRKLISAGLACLIAAEIFGGLAALHVIPN